MQATIVESSPQLRLVPRHPLKLVVLGDSLVYGYGDHEGGGWVERLRRRWMLPGSAGHVIYNLGVRGDRALQVAQRLESEFRYRGELRNRVPDAIILSVGVNDCARVQFPQGRHFTPMEEFQRIVDDLLEQSQQLCPVFFVGMVPVDEGKMPFQNCLYYNLSDQFRYKEIIRSACLQRNIPYLDLFEAWMNRGEHWWKSRLLPDGLHPNVAGYQSLFQDILHWKPIAQISSHA